MNLFNLPQELVDIVYEYLPIQVLIWTNRENYFKHHKKARPIKRRMQFMRFAIRNDYEILFSIMLRENKSSWEEPNKYTYKNQVYGCYMDYLAEQCIVSKSDKCRAQIINTGYKNKYKKKSKSIQWTN